MPHGGADSQLPPESEGTPSALPFWNTEVRTARARKDMAERPPKLRYVSHQIIQFQGRFLPVALSVDSVDAERIWASHFAL